VPSLRAEDGACGSIPYLTDRRLKERGQFRENSFIAADLTLHAMVFGDPLAVSRSRRAMQKRYPQAGMRRARNGKRR
jgi:hypothetical protein